MTFPAWCSRACRVQPDVVQQIANSVRAAVARCAVLLMLCLGLLANQSASAADWADVRKQGQFTVYSEVRLEQFVGLMQTIEQHHADVIATLELAPNKSPIEIYILANSRSYRAHATRHAPEGVSRRAVFAKDADGVGRVFLYVHKDFEIDLRHELTHAVLHSMLAFIPMWLDEGLAEYFEVPAEDRASGNPHQTRLKWNSRLGWRPDLKDLESKESVSEMSVADYREAWAWVHTLIHGSAEETAALQNYLEAIERGEPPGPLSAHLARLDKNFGRRVTTHIKNWK